MLGRSWMECGALAPAALQMYKQERSAPRASVPRFRATSVRGAVLACSVCGEGLLGRDVNPHGAACCTCMHIAHDPADEQQIPYTPYLLMQAPSGRRVSPRSLIIASSHSVADVAKTWQRGPTFAIAVVTRWSPGLSSWHSCSFLSLSAPQRFVDVNSNLVLCLSRARTLCCTFWLCRNEILPSWPALSLSLESCFWAVCVRAEGGS